MLLRAISRRDAFLVLFGAASMHIWSLIFNPAADNAIFINTHLSEAEKLEHPQPTTTTVLVTPSPSPSPSTSSKDPLNDPLSDPPTALSELPHTSIVAHAPGWTLFQNLYMSNGTFLIVSPSNNSFPEIRMMTSTGLAAENTPENIALREPTADNMDFLTPEQAQQRWGLNLENDNDGRAYRVWSVKGNTVLFNDPSQFLHHYFHFVAELFLGTWAFWLSAFTQPSSSHALSLSLSTNSTFPPPIHRAIFAHSDPAGWHDRPGFNGYFRSSAFPSLSIESQPSWEDLVASTQPHSSDPVVSNRAWHFPYLLLTDRSAAHRGFVCGSQTQRTAAEAWQYMFLQNRLVGVHAARWWDPVREAVWKFAGVNGADAVSWMNQEQSGGRGYEQEADGDRAVDLTPDSVRQGMFQPLLPRPKKIIITYISRQPGRGRKLAPESHDDLVKSLNELVERRNASRSENGDDVEWEFNVVVAEKLTKDEQIRVAASTTILLGIHGNGLTHLVFMPPTRISTVIEIFYPGGFAHDYQWTSTALGMKHFGVWNDTHFTLPEEPKVAYPPGFHDDLIPVHGPSVANLIEDRVDGTV